MADATFQIDVQAKATAAEQAAAHVDALSKSLTTASEAASAASEALAAGEAAYARSEAAADRASKAVEKIGVSLEAQRAKLSAAMNAGDEAGFWRAATAIGKLEEKQRAATAAAEQAKAAVVSEAAAVAKLASASDAAAKAQDAASKALAKGKKETDAAAKAAAAAAGSGKVNEIAEGLGKLGGPVGLFGQKAFGAAEGFKKLTASLGGAGFYVAIAAAIATVAVGIAAVSAAAVVGAAKIGIWAFQLADTARANALLTQGLTQSVKAGDALEAKFGELQDKVPQTRDELVKLATDLKAAGTPAEEIGDKLQEAAEKAAEKKFGPEWRKQLLGVAAQTDRLKRGFSKLFSGLKIEKTLEGMSTLTDLFSENNAAGRAIKVVFESMFQPLLDGVTALIPKMRTAFIQAEIMALKALIAIKPYGSTILGIAKVFGVMAAVVGGVVLVALGLVGASMAVLGFAISAVITAVVALVAGVVWLASAMADLGNTVGTAIVGAFTAAVEWLRALDLAQIGSDLLQGLIDGIVTKGPAVLQALGGVVTGAIDGAKNLLGIASPSKVFAEIGGHTADGMAQGVEGGSADVQGALETMVSPPEVKAAPASAVGGGGGANLAGAVFNFYGVEGAEDAVARIGEALTRVLEGDASQLGGAVPA